MPTFEIQGPDGQTYEIDAPDENAAVQALGQIGGQSPSAAPSGAAPKGDFQQMAPGVAKPTQDLPNDTSWLESALFGAADMGTFGTTDELSAWLSSMLDGKDYGQALEHARNRMKTAQIEHPIANIAGGVAGAIPMAMTGIGAAGEGAGLGGRVLAGALTGAGTGALHGYGSGQGGPMNRAIESGKEAGIGGVIGGAVPAIGYGIGKVVQALRGARIPVGNDPALTLGKAITRDGLTPADAGQMLDDLGPEAMLPDVGMNVQQQAGGIAATPGNAQKLLADAIRARQQGANGRILSGVDDVLGPAPVPSQVDAGIRASQGALSPEYQQALAGAQAVDTAPIAEGLDAQAVNLRGAAQRAVQRVRDMLNVAGDNVLDPNPQTLLETRKAIDGMLATEADPNAVRALTAARGQIDDALSASVPGLKPADAKFAELARQREALAQGANVLDSGKTAIRPSELVDQVIQSGDPNLVGPSGVPFRLSQGARAEIDRLLGTHSNDVVKLADIVKGEGSWNRDRLATLFGPERTDALLRILDREKTYQGTANAVLGNSLTAARLSAQRELGIGAGGAIDKPAGVVRSLLNLKPGDAVTAAIDKVTAGLSKARKEQAVSEMARMLTAQGPERQAAIQRITEALTALQAGQGADKAATMLLTPVGRATAAHLSGH